MISFAKSAPAPLNVRLANLLYHICQFLALDLAICVVELT